MDIYCPKCAEPWDNDSLHEEVDARREEVECRREKSSVYTVRLEFHFGGDMTDPLEWDWASLLDEPGDCVEVDGRRRTVRVEIDNTWGASCDGDA